uniref:Phenylalanine--tRNA ligase n=1 Tax=Timema cristinae TaxID=61476 RepID=A0A7R9GVW0_TIMCR|nr:unnamed protein product [Timema cristinae]
MLANALVVLSSTAEDGRSRFESRVNNLNYVVSIAINYSSPCPYSFQKVIPNFKVGFSKAMSSGWVSVDKSSGAPVIHRKVESVTDTVSLDLQRICSGQGDQVAENFKQDYKKRKLLQQVVTKSFLLGKGSNFSTTVNKPETDLTPEMIATGSWRQKTFKPYNLDALGVPPECGHLHPLLKVRSQFRQIFLEMG